MSQAQLYGEGSEVVLALEERGGEMVPHEVLVSELEIHEEV